MTAPISLNLNATQVIDVSRLIAAGAIAYPGDPPLVIEPVSRIGPGSPASVTRLCLSTHLLTHLDPPCHFIEGGAAVDAIEPARLIGTARVVEVAGDAVAPGDLPDPAGLGGLNLLFKTRHSAAFDPYRFDERHVHLLPETAAILARAGVNLVGIDYLSVERFGDEHYPVHRILLGAGVLILEGLDLSNAPAGDYTLVALPLRIAGGDGSPVRAVLLR
ncbi:MAG: cyclase family protein [bacterium]|nr:cyclase family protein [bacterium]